MNFSSTFQTQIAVSALPYKTHNPQEMKRHVTVPIEFLGSHKNTTSYISNSLLHTIHVSIVSYS